VGELNHKQFIWLLGVATVAILADVRFVWRAIEPLGNRKLGEWFNSAGSQAASLDHHSLGVPMLLFLITFVGLILVGSLLFYHLYLAFTGQTTWEHFSRRKIRLAAQPTSNSSSHSSYLRNLPSSVRPFASPSGYLATFSEFLHRPSLSPHPLTKEYHLVVWEPRWHEGDEVGFDWCDNDYWSCC